MRRTKAEFRAVVVSSISADQWREKIDNVAVFTSERVRVFSNDHASHVTAVVCKS